MHLTRVVEVDLVVLEALEHQVEVEVLEAVEVEEQAWEEEVVLEVQVEEAVEVHQEGWQEHHLID